MRVDEAEAAVPEEATVLGRDEELFETDVSSVVASARSSNMQQNKTATHPCALGLAHPLLGFTHFRPHSFACLLKLGEV